MSWEPRETPEPPVGRDQPHRARAEQGAGIRVQQLRDKEEPHWGPSWPSAEGQERTEDRVGMGRWMATR